MLAISWSLDNWDWCAFRQIRHILIPSVITEMWPLMTSSKYTRAIYQQLIIVKWSLFDGKKDGVFVTFQKDRRQLCKHWNSVIAMHTQIFQSSKKLQLRLENSNILVMFLRCTLRSETIFGSWKLFKNDEKGFLFHVNSSFCSQDMQVFALTFWSCSKTAS